MSGVCYYPEVWLSNHGALLTDDPQLCPITEGYLGESPTASSAFAQE